MDRVDLGFGSAITSAVLTIEVGQLESVGVGNRKTADAEPSKRDQVNPANAA